MWGGGTQVKKSVLILKECYALIVIVPLFGAGPGGHHLCLYVTVLAVCFPAGGQGRLGALLCPRAQEYKYGEACKAKGLKFQALPLENHQKGLAKPLPGPEVSKKLRTPGICLVDFLNI